MTTRPDSRDALVRFALKLDAVGSGLSGLVLLAAAPLRDDLFGTPPAARWAIGLFLVVFGTSVWMVGARRRVNAHAVLAVLATNLLWIIASVATVEADWFTLTGLGTVVTLVQAVAVALVASLELIGLRRLSRS